MSFAPWFPWWSVLLVGAPLLGLCLWLAIRRDADRAGSGQMGKSGRIGWFRRAAMVLLLTMAFLRPGVGGVDASSAASQLDVFFVADTTSSVVAQDFGNGQPRLAGVQSDINAITEKLPGASFSLIGFAQDARVLVPLTSDVNALANSVAALGPEITVYSRGSSVTVAATTLVDRLAAAKKSHPDRARVVYYLGDGEQTAAKPPAPFDLPEGLVSGGAVLGYGTSTGGKMKVNSGFGNGLGPGYIQDYSTGADAVSMIDENMLRNIAQQLDVGYLPRNAGDGIAPAISAVQPGALTINGQSAARAQFELYWIFGLGLAGLAGWELFALMREIRRLRPPAAAARKASEAQGAGR